ncbi:MaoC family dehydratase N-terminal domain-containing protein [Cupriavidus sp. U2]|uniref:FAS1-like dehydratase domain-containing protein n=1 Tax=Cupriavidus sp. U2 TaxID=2920269 RepID=UPI00129ECE3C|nr:MaoC family dehydratase N-terminal domain-containing protein [Cupriavidus sp. U2]
MNKATTQKDKNGIDIVGTGFHWDDVEVGYKFRTLGRTITDTDITLFAGITGMVEEMFTNLEYVREVSVIGSRPAPGSLVFCLAEGLLMQSTMQRTGMAFLEADLKICRPTTAGDTIHVECEVIETRSTSKPGRGLMRTANKVMNQRGELVATYSPLRMVKSRPISIS